MFKDSLKDLEQKLTKDVTTVDDSVEIGYRDRGDFEADLKFSGDVLIFSMHTNVFTFVEDHPIHDLKFVKENPQRAYCGLIQIYNFLSDSVKYNRTHDYGYLIGRIFVNSENHFYIEGKDRLGFPFKDFDRQILDNAAIEQIIARSMLFCVDFELFAPPYEQSSIISLEEKQFNYSNSGMNTGKRVGFEFNVQNRVKNIGENS
jgi:hypothetical protein